MADQQRELNNSSGRRRLTVSELLQAIAAAWVLSLGIDFLLHAGLLAHIYLEPSPFVLDPEQAFMRIPLGYASFLILTASFYWLLRRLHVRRARNGFRLGSCTGLVVWGAFVLGLYSISTIEWPMAIAWWLGQSLELGLAGALLGAVEGGMTYKRAWAIVAVAVVVCFVLTIFMQVIGWAPPMKTR